MTNSLPPDIEEILRFERERPPESTATLDQLQDHLRTTLGLVVEPPGDGSSGTNGPSGSEAPSGSSTQRSGGGEPGGDGSVGASSGTAGTSSIVKAVAGSTAGAKAMVAVAVGAFAAGGVAGARWQAHQDSNITYPSPVVSVVYVPATSSSLASTAPSAPAIEVEDLPTVTPSAPTVAPSMKPSVSAEPSPDPLAAERTLIDVARAGAARGRTAEALAALDNHARRFPRGSLVEEREGLRIQVLLAAGRIDEARSRVVRFRSSFPTSLLLPSIEAQLGTRDPSMDGGD